jgi:glycosyltransferase involved in cell wall biosynthesis
MLTPYGEKKPSGLSAFILNLAQELVRQSPQHFFSIFVKGEHDVPAFQSFANVTLKRMSANIFWKDVAVLQNPDIDIWLYNNPSLPLLVRPKKSVVTALDFGIFYDRLRGASFVQMSLNKYLQKRSLEHATHVICTSDATKNDVLTFFPKVSKEKISVSMCGYTRVCEVYQSAPIKNLPSDYFLLVGVIKPRKNQLTAVAAYLLAREKGLQSKLVITGSGTGAYFDSVMEAIELSPFKDDISYMGYRTREEMVTLYKNARALIFPSHVEGFGMPIAEAMSCGTPVICSSNGAMGEVAIGYALTVDSSDVKGFADAMFSLQDEELRNMYMQRGLLRSEDFSWERSAREYTTILESLTSNEV